MNLTNNLNKQTLGIWIFVLITFTIATLQNSTSYNTFEPSSSQDYTVITQ